MDARDDSAVPVDFSEEKPLEPESDAPNEETLRIAQEDHEILMDLINGRTAWQRSVSSQLRKIDANLTILGASVRQLVAAVNAIGAVRDPKLQD